MDMDITLARIAVAMVAKESTIGCIDADGVEQWEQGVRPGRVALKQFVQFMGPNDQLTFGDGVTPLVPAGRAVPQQHRPQDFESGANPDFKPTMATTLQRRMALQMKRLQDKSDAVERRIAGLASIAQKRPESVVDFDKGDVWGDKVDEKKSNENKDIKEPGEQATPES